MTAPRFFLHIGRPKQNYATAVTDLFQVAVASLRNVHRYLVRSPVRKMVPGANLNQELVGHS
jgi:hypothetical protein